MKHNTHYIMGCLLGSMVFAGITACSGDDDTTVKKEPEQETAEKEVKVRRLTITDVDGSAAEAKQAITRASLTDNGNLVPSWTAGDELAYCNLSETHWVYDEEEGDVVERPYSGTLTATTTAIRSQFTGDVECNEGNYLAVVYPATTFDTNESYTISLSSQDGTLETLASSFHHVYGKAYIESVTEQTADATMSGMKSLLTVCKFSFVDGATSSSIPIKKLEITYGGIGSDANKYPQSATVTIKDDVHGILEPSAVHATDDDVSAPLSITCKTELNAVYVALVPTRHSAPGPAEGPDRTFNFTVTNGSGANTYTGTAKATLVEGEYVVATGLKLTRQ